MNRALWIPGSEKRTFLCVRIKRFKEATDLSIPLLRVEHKMGKWQLKHSRNIFHLFCTE